MWAAPDMAMALHVVARSTSLPTSCPEKRGLREARAVAAAGQCLACSLGSFSTCLETSLLAGKEPHSERDQEGPAHRASGLTSRESPGSRLQVKLAHL